VLAGAGPGRQGAEQVTVCKSLGIAAQDLAAARVVYGNAVAQAVGTVVGF